MNQENNDNSILIVPPHSDQAEMSLLGAILVDNSSFEKIDAVLTSDDFYRNEHRIIFKTISEMLGEGLPADVITVGERLRATPEVGGFEYLNRLAQYVLNSSSIRTYASTVHGKSMLRKLISACSENISDALDPSNNNPLDVLEKSEKRILQIGENGVRKEAQVKSNDEQLDELMEWMVEGSSSLGVKTGFVDIDEAMSGLQPGELIVIAGRPSMGKTSFAFNIGEYAAYVQKLNVLAISLEMNSLQLNKKRVGSIGRINQESIKKPESMTTDEVNQFADTVKSMRGHVFDVVDSIDGTIESVIAISRRSAKKHKKLDLIIIDYIQLMGTKNNRSDSNRAGELGVISSKLKALARELSCPVIVLSQLNRDVEKRPNKRPLMSDLKDSGSIEQDADAVILLYRDDYYNKENSSQPGIAEANIGKQRMGPTPVVRLAWNAPYARFDNLANGYQD